LTSKGEPLSLSVTYVLTSALTKSLGPTPKF
jgi:hypothetical protein